MAREQDVPLPKKPLGEHCSALVNNTLYTFAEDSFESLELEKGSEWKELPLLFGTKGAACVLAHEGEALYILGGTSANATMVPEKGYMGIQKYTFRTGKWDIIPVADPIAYNVTNHGALFLEDTQEILMYSGTRWPDTETPSAMTFLIKTAAPYIITAVAAETAPPLLASVLLPWGSDSALIVGGGTQNTRLLTYGPQAGWRDLGITLPEGLPSRKSGAALVVGDDESIMLVSFDISTTPTKFTGTIVKHGNGTAGDSKDGLTETNWPKYNGTYAPRDVQASFAMASGDDTLVFSGGSEESPLCIFNMRRNTWEDPTEIFSQEENVEVVHDGTGDAGRIGELPTPTPTPTPTASPEAAGAGEGGKLNTIQILFIVLGAIFGVLIILVGALYYIKKRKRKNKSTLGRSGTTRSKMSFQDRGLSFMKETGPVDGLSPPEPERGSGWSTYFSGNSATNLVNLPSRTYSTGGSSVYGTANSGTRFPYGNGPRGKAPASVRSEGLVLDLPGANLNVNADHFSSAGSRRASAETLSSIGGSSYSSGIPESIVEQSAWDPTGHSGGGIVGVSKSPRGWGVVTVQNKTSILYPESAVTVYPDQYGQPGSSRTAGGLGRFQSTRTDNNPANDISWLNLKH